MEQWKECLEVLEDCVTLAVATAVERQPNVRIMNFCCKQEVPGVVYVSTHKENDKVAEFTANKKVSFTSIPDKGVTKHMRATTAEIQKSQHTPWELADLFVAKDPGYKEALEFMGPMLEIYEIHLGKVKLVKDFTNTEEYSF